MDNNVPKIRFEGFNNSWKQHKFTLVFDFLQNNAISRAELAKDGEVMNVHYGDILVKYAEILDIASDEITYLMDSSIAKKYQASLLKNGDVIIADAAEDETVGKCTEITGLLDEIVLSGLHTIPCRPKMKYAESYLGYYMNSDAYHNQLLPLIQGTKISSISKSAIKTTWISAPISEQEQAKIGVYFNKINNLITLHQSKYEKLLDLKESMLYKLFPKEGETIPEMRFEGFSGVWEKRRLGDCFSERIESFPEGELLSVTINSGIKKFSDLERINNSNENKTKYKKVYVGDIAYNSMRMWQGASGYSSFEGIVSPAYTVLRANDGIDAKCFSYLFKRSDIVHMFQVHSKGITSDNWNLKYPDFKELEVYVSPDYEEQKEIGEYFSNLDQLIQLNKDKVEKLKNIKSSLLDKMFV